MKRLIATILCLVMVVGLVPASAWAAGSDVLAEALTGITTAAARSADTIYVLAGGDFQEAGDHANSAENVTNILAQVSQKYETMDGFIFIGDYDCETHDSATETANGITALMGAVQGKYSNINDANSTLTQGNHDYMDSRIDATGGHDYDGYSVFVLNEDDYANGGGSQAGIQALANNLKAWLNNKIGEGYSAPIFISSHLPLAFTPRTVTQGDAKYAKYIFDVLNDAADNGLNIIFLHGHDHAYGPDNYMGGEAIYLKEGDKICIAEAGSTSVWTEETLSFTYMNAGYTGYYSDAFTYVTTAGTDKLTMTVFAITDSEVTVERYSEDGLYNLKSAGYDGSYSNTSVTNVSLGLPKYENVYTSPQKIFLAEAQEYGSIGNWVGVEAETTDDVTTSGNEWMTITAPVPGTEATPEKTSYKYVLDTNGVDANTKYLIVNTSNDGTAYVLTNNNGTVDRTAVTISNGEIIVDSDTNVAWTFSGSASGTVVNQNSRLYPNNGSLALQTSGSTVTISDEDNGEYLIYRTDYQNRKVYVRYNSGWTGTRVNSSSSTTYSVYLFAYDSTITTPGTEATPGKNGTYGKIVGELTYNATVGMTADEAMAGLQSQIDGYYYDAMSTPGSDVTGTKMEDSVLTWEWVDTFNGNAAGDYEVAIKYNNFLLGTAEVVVPATKTYYIAEGNGLYLVDMNTTEANAMAAVHAGVTVYSATDENGTNKTALSDDVVTWSWADKYNGADSGPYTVEILYNGTSLGSVEVKVNVKFETGIETDWTYIGESEATGGTTTVTYTLDTDGIEYGEEHKYIIVDDNEAIVLNANSASNGTAHSITISGNTATLNTRDYEYHMIQTSYNGNRYELITKGDGSQYLYQESNGVRYGTRSSVKFQVNHHGSGVYDIHDIDGTNWYIIYNGGWTVTETTSARVRLYKYTSSETVGGTPGGPIYALIEGNTVYSVNKGSSATQAMAAVKAGITGYIATDANGTGKTELADSDLTWKWKNTFNGNSEGSYWVEISYQGKVLGTVEVRVKSGTINNHPEYPDEGAVKVNKTATGIDFQDSGVAQVEVSASGVPSKKGADVILMLDTSSSMTSHTVTGTSKTRAAVLEESLANLITQFKTPGEDGQLLDIRVAIADFNGFYSSGAYARDSADTMSDDISYSATSEAKVYTGDGSLGAGAFIPVEDLAASYTLNYTSGTNYDYAMDAIYQMGTAIKEANGNEERDLYVIFMSDGAAMQWNYYHSQGASSLWNNWITGAWTADQLTTTNLNCTTHAYYYDEVDHNGDGMLNEHRMANAIKGDPMEQYEVIRKTDTLGTATGEANMYMVPGLGATMFSISFDAQADTNVTEESMDKSIETLATPQTGSTQYYYKVTSADELDAAFNVIGAEIAYAATNARFVDQMGGNFNLQMTPAEYSSVVNGTTETRTLEPKIEILSYEIYTREDFKAGLCEESQIGDRKVDSSGKLIYTVLETVTFTSTKNADGTYTVTGAYSDRINNGTTNILADGTQAGYVKGVIYAKTFIYNTNAVPVNVEGVVIPVSENSNGTTGENTTNELPKETFYWKMGTIASTELAMRYYVYLDGSMEGTKEAGSYATNEFATLYYDNYLGNATYKGTVSPSVAWKAANVSYAFYLVNEDGEIIVNQATGQTGSFANKIAVTKQVLFDEVLLNNDGTVKSLNVASLSDGVLPKYYTLYDEASTYYVSINSNTTGAWRIDNAEAKWEVGTDGDIGTDDDIQVPTGNTEKEWVNSTYVTNFNPANPADYSNDLRHDTVGHDYTHTVVWFAVVWKIEAHPDAVVVDYGLPVDIDVLKNDMFGSSGKLAGIGAYTEGLENTVAGETLQSGFGTGYTGEYGSAKASLESGMVTYTPDTMAMDGYDKFAYAVNYTGTDNHGYYYDTITVIPATSIYYEDSFLDLTSYTATGETKVTEDGYTEKVYDEDETTAWEIVGTVNSNATQDEDRPGKYSLTDANNIYGYDSVNLGMTTYSLGSARKVTVNEDTYATAEFTFTGTGFDVVSMTSNTTGFITAQVTNAEGKVMGSTVVDTYYGYTTELHNVTYTYTDGEWIMEDNGKNETATEVTIVLPNDPTEGDQASGVGQVWVLNNTVDNSLYQVPVLQIRDLPYGTYKAVITATYVEPLDKTTDEGYDLYLDAIRVYDPANNGAADGTEDKTIEDAYKLDGEYWPTYIDLRNKLIDKDTLGDAQTSTTVEGVVFIDGDASVGNAQLRDYKNYGPNNEVYLAPGQRVAFELITGDDVASVHIGIKSADGKAGTYTITNIAKAPNAEEDIKAGAYYNAQTSTMNTATEMYYDLTGWKDDIIVISNTGNRYGTDGIISLTNIKVTYKEAPAGGQARSNVLFMTPRSAAITLATLNEVEMELPEIEQDVPETTLPEETLPEETVPEETEPEVTEPETTQPSEPAPEEPAADPYLKTIAEKISKAISWLRGWFQN